MSFERENVSYNTLQMTFFNIRFEIMFQVPSRCDFVTIRNDIFMQHAFIRFKIRESSFESNFTFKSNKGGLRGLINFLHKSPSFDKFSFELKSHVEIPNFFILGRGALSAAGRQLSDHSNNRESSLDDSGVVDDHDDGEHTSDDQASHPHPHPRRHLHLIHPPHPPTQPPQIQVPSFILTEEESILMK